MRILLTGASSFTGAWFARALSEAGHEVIAPLRGNASGYEGIRAQRVAWIASKVRLVDNAPFGSDRFLELLKEPAPIDVLCHHAADVTNYRSPDFNTIQAVASNCYELRLVLETLRGRANSASVVFTGSVFENDEGLGENPMRAFSPYGLSKALSWQYFRYYCGAAQVRLGKFVIPNPFGRFEEPRFTSYLIRTWKSGAVASVQTPSYVRDNIHVGLLALAYVGFVESQRCGRSPVDSLRPSGYVETQGAFAHRFASEMSQRLGIACKLELKDQSEFAEPACRINADPTARHFPAWQESKAWDELAEFYR